MKKFFYKAIKDKKELVSGYIEAETKMAATDKIRGLGFLPSYIYEEKTEEAKTEPKIKSKIRKLPLKDLILFTNTLQTYIESEIPILNALDNISKQTDRKNIKNLADKLSSGIKNGQSFSQAIDEHSEAVGETYAALCRAGEESGTLSSTFGYLSILLKKQDDLRSKYIRILAYPVIIITITMTLFFVLGGFVLPIFIGLFPSPDDITGTIKFVMSLYNSILNCWWLFLIVGVCFVYSWTDVSLRKKLKGFVENILINVPIIKNCMRYMSLSHYMNVLYFAYEAGIPIVDAMRLAENTIFNKPINNKAKTATSIVLHNKPISEAYYETDLIPSEFMPIIGAGEEAGRLGQAFRDVAIAITNKLDLSIDVATKAMEPVLMSVVGVFVAIIIISFLQAYIAASQF